MTNNSHQVEQSSVLDVRNITLDLAGRRLLDNISFTVKPGEVVAVLGPNGAGKSTLFRSICGEQGYQQGEIFFSGQARDDYNRKQLANILGILPQSSKLSFPFTVREVIALGRINHPDGRAEQQALIEHVLSEVDGLHLAERTYTELSGGEQQCVHLARVLAQIWDQPKEQHRCLLLDEPTSALDLAHQHRTLELVSRFAEQDVGVLVILHDLNLAARYADRILILQQGQLVAAGTPWQVLTSDMIKNVFDIQLQVLPHPNRDVPLLVA